jgi:hypothetical protein
LDWNFYLVSHICESGKEFDLSFHIFYKGDTLATLGYVSLGSGKLKPDDIRKTHSRLILAFSKAVGLGQSFAAREGRHSGPV